MAAGSYWTPPSATVSAPALSQIADQFLGKQRIAFDALGHSASQCIGQLGQTKSRGNQSPDVLRRQRFQRQSRDMRLPHPF
jgi:hypothetical protein